MKKAKKTTSAGQSNKGVSAQKYYQGTKPKKVAATGGSSGAKNHEVFDNMLTPRNVIKRR